MIVQFEEAGDPGFLVLDCFEARTPEEHAEGLSHAESLPSGTGLLFFFEEEAPRVFWMPETMRFPIDVIFIKGNKQVGGVATECQPGDPQKYRSNAKWVLEVAAGMCQAYGIKRGSVVAMEREEDEEDEGSTG